MGAIETALERFALGKLSEKQLETVMRIAGGNPDPVGASTATAEAETETETESRVCNRCEKGESAGTDHRNGCVYKGKSDSEIALIKENLALKAQMSNGGSIPPAQGLELVETFEVPFQKATDGVYNLYGWTTEECKADNTRKFGKYYSNKLQFATGRKLEVTFKVIA